MYCMGVVFALLQLQHLSGQGGGCIGTILG